MRVWIAKQCQISKLRFETSELQDCTRCTCEDHRVSGKVSDSSGQAIAGASIRRKDDFIQTLAFSDFNGEFRLENFKYLFERFLEYLESVQMAKTA